MVTRPPQRANAGCKAHPARAARAFAFALQACINLSYFPTAYFADLWIYQADGLGRPGTDCQSRLAAAGRRRSRATPRWPTTGYIQKQVELAPRETGFFRLFRLALSAAIPCSPRCCAQFPYAVAFIGWTVLSIIPYLAAMRAIVGPGNFGLLLAIAFPARLQQYAGWAERLSDTRP